MLDRALLAARGVFLSEDTHQLLIDHRAEIELPIAIRRRETAISGDVRIGAFSTAHGSIDESVARVGRYCSIAWGVHFATFEHPLDRITTHGMTYHAGYFGHGPAPAPIPPQERIVIENDVFVGERAYIKGGVTLHTGCVVGAHAVVTRDVPPYAVVAGNPARVMKMRFDDATIARLLASQWWRFDLRRVPFSLGDLERTLTFIEARHLPVYEGERVSGAELVRDAKSLEAGPGAIVRA